jgi:hypothetical protein
VYYIIFNFSILRRGFRFGGGFNLMQEKIKNIIKEKVTGVYEPMHDASGHRYRNTKTGHIQRSVTTKLGILHKPHLAKWQIRVAIEWLQVSDRWKRLGDSQWKDELMTGAMMAPFDIRDDAGGVGNIAHNAIERYINDWIASGERPENITQFAPENCDPRAIASMRAAEVFFNKNSIIPIASELLVGDIRYSAGTLDFLAIMNGKLTLIDHKTSNGVDQISYSAQVAAYKYFFEKMTGLTIKQCKILHLSKDYDKFTVYDVRKLPAAYKAFKQICGVYDWMYAYGEEKIIKDIKRITI